MKNTKLKYLCILNLYIYFKCIFKQFKEFYFGNLNKHQNWSLEHITPSPSKLMRFGRIMGRVFSDRGECEWLMNKTIYSGTCYSFFVTFFVNMFFVTGTKYIEYFDFHKNLFIQGLYYCTTNSDPCTIITNLGWINKKHWINKFSTCRKAFLYD